MDFKPAVERALGELSMIIDSEADEETFQKWFENNEVVFRCLGYHNVIPHPRLDADINDEGTFVPDFMAINGAGVWEIIEIKPAKALILTKTNRRHALRASTNSYVSQCTEYANLFGDRDYRERFNNNYGVNCHKTPQVMLIMGRSLHLDRHHLQEILSHHASPHIEIRTFDDVRQSVYDFVATSHEVSTSGAPGVCIVFSAVLLRSSWDAHVIDIRKTGAQSRVQVCVRGTTFVVLVTDIKGKVYQAQIADDEGGVFFERFASFAIQIASHDHYSCIEILIDDQLVCESRHRCFDIDFTDQLDQVVGSDQLGNSPSCMLFGPLLILKTIPLIEERWVLRSFVLAASDGAGQKYFHEYIGHKFMHTPRHPTLGGVTPFASCLMQEHTEHKPTLRLVKIDEMTGKPVGYRAPPNIAVQ